MKKTLAVFSMSGKLSVPCDDTEEAKGVAAQVVSQLQSELNRIIARNPAILAGGVKVALRPMEFPLSERCVEGLSVQTTMALPTPDNGGAAREPTQGMAPMGVVSITRGGRKSKKAKDETAPAEPN